MEQLPDVLVRGTAWGGKIRVFAACTTQLVNELQRRHHTMPTATAAFGRTATAAAIMGAMLKGEEQLTVKVKGDGPIGQIVVDANAHGEVRGYVDNPDVLLPSNEQGKIDVAGGVGRNGYLHIIKDLGLKDPYLGSVPIVSGELGEDFTYYFAVSEQTPSAVGLGVLVEPEGRVTHAGGFILQLLPGLTDEEITRLEQTIGSIPHVTKLMEQGETPEGILRRLVGDDLHIHDTLELKFQCKCSRDRVEQTLISLGASELEQIIEEDGKAEVVCHYCNEAYTFDREQLQELLDQAKPKLVQ
ncbi:Hsp33 family molecular chaperone HslO [Paenibacillus sp. BK720]|uniref:Hsp33 family molecular chaperone HslO n=1 Tax=Paenibacillus sp. BK720 TaxID=2587092 RepID=UPI00141F7A85|nr:Hsp33 family molecular chaperone HslO [Paenibacillus sp. BK720]NIK72164.1 molecular chaperone Hsp33 [Paenibacillus sp. BK720]